MAFDPLFINASGGVPAYSANELRAAMALAMQYGGRAVGARQGVRPGGTPFLVTVDGSLNITVKAGVALVDPGLSTPQGPYWVAMVADDTTTLDVTAHDPTNPRIDIVYIRVRDDDEDGSGLRQAELGYLAGTPAGSPVQPATPASALLLASLAVPALSGAVAVTDRRVFTAATGGLLPVATQAERDALTPYEGQEVYRLDTDVTNHYNGAVWVDDGYRLLAIQTFLGSGSFTKATYPGLRAVLVETVGSGGAGGGAAATGVGESAAGGGGKGGAWAEKFVLAASLSSSETVTVPAGGTGVAGADGNDGAQTSFGVHCSAQGGGGGSVMTTGAAAAVTNGGTAGVGSNVGDRAIFGGEGGSGLRVLAAVGLAGYGGETQRANSARGQTGNNTGRAGLLYGGGGGGGSNGASQSARAGGAGAAGVCIVYVYV